MLYAYRFDEQGVLNQDAIAGPLREIAIALGLPAFRAEAKLAKFGGWSKRYIVLA